MPHDKMLEQSSTIKEGAVRMTAAEKDQAYSDLLNDFRYLESMLDQARRLAK